MLLLELVFQSLLLHLSEFLFIALIVVVFEAVAEALRELGEFAKAEELLDFKFDEEMTHAVDVIRELIRNRVTTVTEIKGQ